MQGRKASLFQSYMSLGNMTKAIYTLNNFWRHYRKGKVIVIITVLFRVSNSVLPP